VVIAREKSKAECRFLKSAFDKKFERIVQFIGDYVLAPAASPPMLATSAQEPDLLLSRNVTEWSPWLPIRAVPACLVLSKVHPSNRYDLPRPAAEVQVRRGMRVTFIVNRATLQDLRAT
jgi:hypothetical protein